MKPESRSNDWLGSAALVLAASLAAGALAEAHAASEGESAANRIAPRQDQRHHAASLEDRVRLLSKALDLDAMQQAELKKVLERERERIAKAWSDPAVPAAYRITATQAASERTADEIRAFLNEGQKKKYKPPRSSAVSELTRSDVGAWMSAGKPK